MYHAVERQVEVGMHRREAGEAARGDSNAVIAEVTTDQLLLCLPADLVVVVPDDLDGRVVCLRTGIGEQDVVQSLGRDVDQFLRKADAGLMRAAAENLRVG